MRGRGGVARVLFAFVPLLGCGGPEPTPAPAKPAVALAIRRPDSGLRVFSGTEETPAMAYEFDGAPGSVRVTMELEGSPASPSTKGSPPAVNDVLFKAEGRGRIAIAFERPKPERPNGRVTITCLSGGEESSASFEPELWYHLPGAIVTFEPTTGEPADSAAPGKEIVLGRYVARNVPQDVRLTFKAVFTREPLAPRTKTELRAPR